MIFSPSGFLCPLHLCNSTLLAVLGCVIRGITVVVIAVTSQGSRILLDVLCCPGGGFLAGCLRVDTAWSSFELQAVYGVMVGMVAGLRVPSFRAPLGALLIPCCFPYTEEQFMQGLRLTVDFVPFFPGYSAFLAFPWRRSGVIEMVSAVKHEGQCRYFWLFSVTQAELQLVLTSSVDLSAH